MLEFDFPKLIGALSDEERISFYEFRAHNLINEDKMSESDSWEGIKHWVALSPEISPHVEWALKTSYDVCRR